MADERTEEPGTGDNERRSYEVGYGKPPRDTRFQAGQSGNPRGRPKGARGLRAELRAELDERVTITVDGKQRRIPKRRLIIKALAAKAAKGDVKAADKLLSLIIQAEGFEDQRPTARALSDTETLMFDRFFAEIAAVEESQDAGEPPAGTEEKD